MMANKMLQCSVNDFLGHYLPWQVPEHVADNVHNLLVKEDDHNRTSVESMAQGLPIAFKKLKDIFGCLHKPESKQTMAKIGRTPILVYKNSVSEDTSSKTNGNKVCADYVYLAERRDKPSKHTGLRGLSLNYSVDYTNIAVVAGLQKHARLIGDVTHILNNDPRRTWMYAITFENTMMSMWYFSRSHTAVSIPFDYTKDMKSFIHVLISLIYATKEEIGYDPTIHRVLDGTKAHYVYEINFNDKTRYFKALETLASGPHRIAEKATRVWKAVEVEGYEDGRYGVDKERGKEVALKDYWPDATSKTEKSILCDIFRRLEEVKHDPTLLKWAGSQNQQLFLEILNTGKYKQYFMGIEADVQLTTTKLPLPTAEPVSNFSLETFSGSIETSSSSRETSSGDTQTSSGSMETSSGSMGPFLGINMGALDVCPNRRKSMFSCGFRQKRHCRMVYEEIGQSLYTAKFLRSAFNAMADTLIALTLLYLAGYVHRDISPGNIIMVEQENKDTRGKLSDFEYTKLFQDESSNMRTGTPPFMAFEVYSGQRLYQHPIANDFDTFTVTVPDREVSPIPLSAMPKQPMFRFTHDLECLLWVCLYFPAKYLPGVASDSVFNNRPSRWRQYLISASRDDFQHFLQARLHPNLAHFIAHLGRYQNALKFSYMDQNSVDSKRDPTTYGRVYNACLRAFSDIRGAFDSGVLPQFDFGGVVVEGQRPCSESQIQRKRPVTGEERNVEEVVDRPVRKQPRRKARMGS